MSDTTFTLDDVRKVPRELFERMRILPLPTKLATKGGGIEDSITVLVCWDPNDVVRRAAAITALGAHFPEAHFRFMRLPGDDEEARFFKYLDRTFDPKPVIAKKCTFCGATGAHLVAGKAGSICPACLAALESSPHVHGECVLCATSFDGLFTTGAYGICASCKELATKVAGA